MQLFGILTLQSFIQPSPVATGAQLLVVFAGLGTLAYLARARRFVWLWREWLTSVDHKRIGVMYLVLAGVMAARGFVDATLMRSQQAVATGGSAGFLSPEHYAEIFTAHGVIMIFFVAMPAIFGLINLMVPLQIGAKDVAFPTLNSISFWLTLAGAMLVNASLVVGQFAATGWIGYPPLSELAYSPGVGVDYYIWALQVAGAGSLLSGINFITTIATMRAAGMRLMQMPLFVWTTLGSMLLVVFAFPILTATLALLSFDRTLFAHIFTADLGGSAMMFVNLIWAWGHPEVYILMLPAFGIFSEVVSTFSHKKLFGYTSMVIATMCITVLSFMVWLHHFFTMGASADVNAFFGIMTMVIAIPTGVKVFNWLFTMFRGRIVFATPMLWFMGFLTTFILGGMTGVLLAVPGADYQLHNSLFLVAHFHNMIIGGVLFGLFAGVSYWWPKITGYYLHEGLGRAAFWAWVIGFLMAFMPLYALGLMGMTRRLYEIQQAVWVPLLWVAAAGVVVIALAIALQVAQFALSIIRRNSLVAPDNAWGGTSLEWQTPLSWDNERSSLGVIVGILAGVAGFAMVWHLWWLAVLGLLLTIASFIVHSYKTTV